MLPPTADFLVIGGGIIGINIALALVRRFPGQSIALIEKEDQLGMHASGRNSGILHAGFYYSADSLKARFSREGNAALTAYCVEKGLRINRCGKLVVAQDESELAGLDELLRRGRVNNVRLEDVTEAEAQKIEPRVRTFQRAIFSPTTSAVDPTEVMLSLAADAEKAGVTIARRTKYRGRGRNGTTVRTSSGKIDCGYVVNAAGLYADRIARDYGFSENYRILPFKGVYLYAEAEMMRTNIYPVPNLANPFLGVHFTVTTRGRTKIGPTAIPAFWREQYGWIGGFSARELADIVARQLGLLVRNDFGFRSLALSEVKKYRRSNLVALAAKMVRDLDPTRYTHWGKPGIRAQLLDIRTRQLVSDFHLEGDDRSMHVLNAVSPAFTSSIPFAAYVVDRI
ncbi:MAG TPA: L-2-hydroxyglutarate oxidase [Gemmatimonadaceae bacterium]|nr:L-2-hydroxyglutarate oxidase [Gemmatimonadaceae bacterium]